MSNPEGGKAISSGQITKGRNGRRSGVTNLSVLSAVVTRHGYIDPSVADDVFRLACADWGLEKTDAAMREMVLVSLAVLALQGTSAAMDYDDMHFSIGGSSCRLSVLVGHAQAVTRQPNPLRVFYRSFRQAEIPVRQYELLADPANVEIRAEAMARYNCSPDKLQVCFDMFMDAVPFIDGSASLIPMARVIMKSHLREYQEGVQSRGIATALHDTSNRQADSAVSYGANAGVMSHTTQSERLGVQSLRM